MRLLRRRRRPNVEKLRGKGDLAGLLAALSYEDRYVSSDGTIWDIGAPTRAEAAHALAGFDDPAAGDALLDALADPDPKVRAAVVEGIAGLAVAVDPEPVVDRLIRWRARDESEAAARALDILVESRVEGLAEILVTKLLHPAAPAIEERDRDATNRLLAVDPRGAAAQASLAQLLLGALEEPNDDMEEGRAEEMLVWLGPAAGEALLAAFERGVKHLGLVRAAGVVGDARLREPLVQMLQDPEADPRAAAARALSGLADTRAVPALVHATQDPDQPVRYAASEALNTMGIAAVIVGVASVIQEAVGEQLERSPDLPAIEPAKTEPIADVVEAQLAHPPTWAQEILGRLRKRDR